MRKFAASLAFVALCGLVFPAATRGESPVTHDACCCEACGVVPMLPVSAPCGCPPVKTCNPGGSPMHAAFLTSGFRLPLPNHRPLSWIGENFAATMRSEPPPSPPPEAA